MRPLRRIRWVMVALCFSATAINYIDRANISFAVPFLEKEFGLSSAQMGVILSGFFWSYSLMQLPAGRLIDRFGPKPVYAFSAAWWSVLTMSTAFGRGLRSLFGCRVLLGIGESAAYPCNAKVTATWIPASERAVASSIFDSGARVGTLLSSPIVGFLILSYGWRTSFVVTGLLGFGWIVVWWAVYRDPSPEERPAASASPPTGRAGPSWWGLFRYRSIWAMCLGFFCLNFAIYFFITWFPTYLVQARGFSILKVGTQGAVPALCAIGGGWIGGYVSDALYRAGWSLTAARKTCLAGGMALSSCIALAAFVPTAQEALLLFSLSYAGLAFTGASVWSLPGDMAPTDAHVGSIAGIQNFASNLAGIVTTTFTGVMLTLTHGSFVIPLLVGGGMCLLGAFAYLFMLGPVRPLGT